MYMDEKICSRCKQVKLLIEFGNRAEAPDGLSYTCYTCERERGRKKREVLTGRRKLPDYDNFRKNCYKCGELKSADYFNKKAISEDGLDHWCTPCKKEYRGKNREVLLAQRRIYVKNNKEVLLEKSRKYKENNREYIKEQTLRYRKDNREAILEKGRQYSLSHREAKKEYDKQRKKDFPHLGNSHNAKRRAYKLNQTPLWSEKEEIKQLYKKSKELETLTGVKYHIDHKVPLRHKYVSGLHCLANLRVIPATENISKGNRYWTDMPDYSTIRYDPVANILID